MFDVLCGEFGIVFDIFQCIAWCSSHKPARGVPAALGRDQRRKFSEPRRRLRALQHVELCGHPAVPEERVGLSERGLHGGE